MASSIKIYNPNEDFDTDDVKDELENDYSHTRPHPELDELETDVTNIAFVPDGFECTIRYDIADTVRVRGGTDPVRNLRTARVRFVDDYVFFLDFNRRSYVEREVRQILNMSRDDFTQAHFSSGLVVDVTEEDADAIAEGYWDDPTNHASTASLYGDVEDSSLAARFNRDGHPTYAKFESEYFDGAQVGISANKNSIAFWGDRSNDEKVQYFNDVVKPLL